MRRLPACLLLLAAAAHADVLHVPGDVSTIQAAVDSAQAGDTILIASGTYSQPIVVSGKSELVLRGQGQVELAGSPLEIGLDIQDSTSITVERLSFHGQGGAIRADGADDLVLRMCRATDIDETAFLVLNGLGTLIDRCQVDGAGDQGLSLNSTKACVVRRCSFRNVTTGVLVLDSSVVELDHVRVEDVLAAGINVTSLCSAVDVHHSRVTDSEAAGILCAATDCRFSRDLVLRPGTVGFQLQASAQRNVLEKERVVDAGAVSFNVGGLQHDLLACRALRSTGVAFLCGGAGQHLVQDGRAVAGAADGFNIDSAADGCTLLDNRASNMEASGFGVDGDATTVTGNVSSGAGLDGFRVESSNSIFTDNRATGSGDLDLFDLVGGSTYVDNDFGTESVP